MKIFGKFEWKSERSQSAANVPAPEEKVSKSQIESVLLRTYLTSLLSFVLCVSMFLGTSYAWFTSEVNNTVNEIYVGTLKVGLLKVTDFGDKDLATGNTKVFNNNIRWEPGYTALETVKIVNQGDLAFKYIMTFTDGTLENPNGKELADIAQYFDVWVFDHNKNTYQKPTSYNGINEANGWTHVGNLAAVLNDGTVFSGKMEKVRKEAQETTPVNEGTTDGVPTEHTFTIALHLSENVGSEIMGHKISLNIKLIAYQMTYEKDAFGDGYDDSLVITSDITELKNALAARKDVVLSSDIYIKRAEDCLKMTGSMLDGNGKRIIYEGPQVDGKSVGVLVSEGGRITNLTIEGSKNGRALYMTELKSDLVVSNCTLSGEFSFNLNSSKHNDTAIISFANTKFLARTSYSNAANHAYFTDCEFYDVVRPYGDTTMTECTFDLEALDVSELVKAAGETVTLINCYYDGQLIEEAVLISNGTTVEISGTDLLVLGEGAEDRAWIYLANNN